MQQCPPPGTSIARCQPTLWFAGVSTPSKDTTHTGPGENKEMLTPRDRLGSTSAVGISPLWPVDLVLQPTQGYDLHASLSCCRQRTSLPPHWEEIDQAPLNHILKRNKGARIEFGRGTDIPAGQTFPQEVIYPAQAVRTPRLLVRKCPRPSAHS